jgi:hypothetical protein
LYILPNLPILIPSSEGAQRATLKLIAESTIVFKLAGKCAACIIFCNKPHKLIGKHFIASNGVGFQLKFPRGGAAPSILCNTPRWLIVDYSIVPASFYDDFQLVVESILIPSYEGAQRATLKLIVICAFGLNELIKLILASGQQPNFKISLIFGEECRTFCEGEWEQQVGNISLAGYTSLVGLIELAKLISFVGHNGIFGLIGRNNLVGFISLVGHNTLVDHIGLVGRNDLANHIGLDFIGHNGLVGFIGLSINFIGLRFVGFIGLGLVSLGGLTGHISLVGHCIIGLIELAALSNHRLKGLIGLISRFGLLSRIDRISLVGPIGFSGISGLVGQISLVSLGGFIGQISLINLSALSNHWPIGLIGGIGFSLIALSASAVSLACQLICLVSLVGVSTHWPFCKCLAAAVIKATKYHGGSSKNQHMELPRLNQALPKLRP